ncbi:MAG: histidine kinase [Ignavibacteriales bacterium]|nr:histidine kinase [Ignavibacteriales bacterium]
MKKIKLLSAFRFIIILLGAINIEITATEPQHNIISSLKKSTLLDYWQIVKDADPKLSLPSFPDSLWQLFKPTIDDVRYTEGNWILRTNIVIKDSLSGKEVLGLFPINFVTAYEIYWDGIKIAQNGIIGVTKTDEKAGAYNFNLALSPNLVTRGEHTLVFRISNHNNYSSWKWFYGDLIIGKYDSLVKKIFQWNYQAFFITGILFIPFLFNLFLYIARKRKIEHLLFSLICLIVILDSVTMLAPIFVDTRTTFVYWQYYVYQAINVLFTVLFPAFFIYLFSFPKKIIVVIIVTTLFIFLFFTNIGNLFNIMTITVLIISSIITMWALYKRREESVIIFIGIIAAWAAYFLNFAFAGLATTMVICTSLSIARQFARKETAEKEAQLKSSRLENELLKKNINPHFVLNTLTSIIVWLRKDSNSAIKLIEALAEEFRMINQISALKQIPISQEIDLCRAHLKIMSYRKGADYKMETLDIDEQDTIPPMIFHTLVENGLTHGYENKIAGTFKLQTIKNPDCVKYILTNDGEFNSEESKGSTGFGAKYIKGRLEESYPNRWKFRSNRLAQGWESLIEIRNS